MIQTKIAQLEIASSVNDSDYLVIDNTEVTKRATISTLSNKLSSTFNIDQLSNNSANWNSTYTTVQSNSGSWGSGGSITTITEIPSATTSYKISTTDNNNQLIYTGTNQITAFITEDLNITNFTTTITQMSYGSIVIALSSNYAAGFITSINDTSRTIGRGSSVNIKRITNNSFLVTPVFFSLVL